MNKVSKALIVFIFFILVSCSSEPNYAPVMDINMIDAIPLTGSHIVTKGETLYAIAWRYGLDYRSLAQQNHIAAPYAIQVGQHINLKQSIAANEAERLNSTPVAKIIHHETISAHATSPRGWLMPAKGSISTIQKGINIVGRLGEPIHAAASGKVVYSGSGLRGYGNLILIKHNQLYFSAYAHNRINLVREGQQVKQGQKIAEMGNTGTNKVMLYFEIRRAGKPIDPIPLLKS